MIHCHLEPLALADENALRAWFSKGTLEICFKVIEAQVKRHEAEYLALSVESGPENSKAESATVSLGRAQHYNHALEVLRELAFRKDPYQIAKLS